MKLNRNLTKSPAQFQSRLEAQRNALRKNLETVEAFPAAPQPVSGLFKSAAPSPYRSIAELVVAGNREFENLDNVDFATFRNDRTLGQKTLREVTEQVTQFHADRTTPEYRSDLSRVLNARYLQGHGVKVETHLDAQEMRVLRKYLQKETSTYNVADSVRAINEALGEGVEDVDQLTLKAEEFLYTERGLSSKHFEQRFASLPQSDLARIRDFSDAWSTSQGGKFLPLSRGDNFAQHRDSLAREMLASAGYQHVNAIDLDTVLSLLRDIDSEGPRSNATIRNTVNREIAAGEKDYFLLNTRANEAILLQLGVSSEEMARLGVSDLLLSEKYPELAPREARAIRTRVLRDLLRAQPPKEREVARRQLQQSNANLVSAEKVLAQHFRHRIEATSGHQISTQEMGAMQLANLNSALSKLPSKIRNLIFSGSPANLNDRLEALIESKFGIEVHREAGQSPDNNKSVAPFVRDWTPQGLIHLFNAMTCMANDGRLPETLIGHSTIAYVEGSGPSPSMAVGPQPIFPDPVGPWNRPGAFAHASGKSGYYGMCSPDEKGHDVVYFCDDALLGANSDSAESVTSGESTIIHEFGHALQLGGTPDAEKSVRDLEQQLNMAEWSALSRWEEPGQLLADGRMGSFEYYYDPTVQVKKRSEVATSYGASDPCEDFAEYTPYFFEAADVAMELSVEKFLYLNEMVGGHYSETRVKKEAKNLGLRPQELTERRQVMKQKVAAAADAAGL